MTVLPKPLRAILAIALVAVATACARPEPRPHESLSEDLQALRTQFNRDVDRTRILMIVAPT